LYQRERATLSDPGAFADSLVGRLLGGAVLPSLALVQCNTGLVNEAWELVSRLPYRVRYNLYRSVIKSLCFIVWVTNEGMGHTVERCI
jgi:hypothetical protein